MTPDIQWRKINHSLTAALQLQGCQLPTTLPIQGRPAPVVIVAIRESQALEMSINIIPQ